MKFIIDILDAFFSIQIGSKLTIYGVLSIIFKYLFVIIIYYFIFNIIKMIYLDIRGTGMPKKKGQAYLRMITLKESLDFPAKDYYFLNNDTIIGRDDTADIILRDAFISKHHAEIFLQGESYFIEDLNSSNGTYLNSERIYDAIELRDKDLINIGQIQFIFVFEKDGES